MGVDETGSRSCRGAAGGYGGEREEITQKKGCGPEDREPPIKGKEGWARSERWRSRGMLAGASWLRREGLGTKD